MPATGVAVALLAAGSLAAGLLGAPPARAAAPTVMALAGAAKRSPVMALAGVAKRPPVMALTGASASAARSAGAKPTAPHGALIPASEGRPMKVPEPTYRWHGLTVPVGVCGAVVSGRAMVLPCGDKRAVAYRRQRAAQRTAARRRAAERQWVGLGGAVLLAGAGIGAGTRLARRRRVAVAAGTAEREGGGV